MKINHIAILGGGTAGWLAANHLAKKLNFELSKNIEITVIESDEIPTIGVGEGTVPVIKSTLNYFGISEASIFQCAEGSIKQGIKFVNWTDNPKEVGEHHYYHPFEPFNPGFQQYLDAWLCAPEKRNFDDFMGVQAQLCEENLIPKTLAHNEYQSHIDYAYHFDASKFTKLLADNAVNNLGVKRQVATVLDVTLDDDENISELVTSEGSIEADLFVDCSGFQSLLLGKALNVDFQSYSDVLLTDKALAVQVQYDQKNQANIRPYTTATAVDFGWIWDIQLQTRKGVGLVYSSKHASKEEAYSQLQSYLGDSVDISKLSVREIDMKVGHRKVFWKNNCVALGLAQGFVEPLEATGLLVFDMTASMLSYALSDGLKEDSLRTDKFNKDVKEIWQNILSFIKLHYCISNRRDTDFWRDNCAPESIPDELINKLALWKKRPPNRYDFTSHLDIFTMTNYLYVIYGMKYLPENTYTNGDKAHPLFNEIIEYNKQSLSQIKPHCLNHSQFLEKVLAYGIQTR